MFDPSNFEINLMPGPDAPTEILSLANFVMKYNCPSVVTDPSFVETVLIDRLRVNGQYKVICTVDFETGHNFALQKLRLLPKAALAADGFEFLLTPRASENESYNELSSLVEFIRTNLDQMREIRWAFNFRSHPYEDYQNFMPHLSRIPVSFIRTDNNLFTPDVSLMMLFDDVNFIRSYVGTPIKVCGGVTLEAIESLGTKVARFDVSLTQAQELVRQWENQNAVKPEPFKKVFNANTAVGQAEPPEG